MLGDLLVVEHLALLVGDDDGAGAEALDRAALEALTPGFAALGQVEREADTLTVVLPGGLPQGSDTERITAPRVVLIAPPALGWMWS